MSWFRKKVAGSYLSDNLKLILVKLGANTIKHLSIILAFLLTLSSPVAAQDFDRGWAAYETADYATALKEWKPLAEAGHADAQYNLGELYATGKGVAQDRPLGLYWISLAALRGHELAIENKDILTTAMSGAEITKSLKMQLKYLKNRLKCLESGLQKCEL